MNIYNKLYISLCFQLWFQTMWKKNYYREYEHSLPSNQIFNITTTFLGRRRLLMITLHS